MKQVRMHANINMNPGGVRHFEVSVFPDDFLNLNAQVKARLPMEFRCSVCVCDVLFADTCVTGWPVQGVRLTSRSRCKINVDMILSHACRAHVGRAVFVPLSPQTSSRLKAFGHFHHHNNNAARQHYTICQGRKSNFNKKKMMNFLLCRVL